MILSLNPTCGRSGDMLLGVLLDLGAPLDGVRASIAATGLTGWALDVERVTRHGMTACRAVVTVHDDATERPASVLRALADKAAPASVAKTAVAAIDRLAEVEARIHGVDPADVHLHELGGHDTIVDIVGVIAAVNLLGIDYIASGPLPLGSGTVRTRHGLLPVPAPATAALLAGAAVYGGDIPGETVTPTGAVLLHALGVSYEPMPLLRLVRTGCAAGGRELSDRPNVLQASLGELAGAGEYLVRLATNLDDVTGEVLAYTVDRLLQAGAADAWMAPITMKKGRPAHTLHALTTPALAPAIEALIYAETGTLGVRRSWLHRGTAPRMHTIVDVNGHRVRVKHGPHGSKPEHDDTAAAAPALGLPYRDVTRLALHTDQGR